MGWEKLTADLASAAGVVMPRSRLVSVRGRDMLVLDRFDRQDFHRVGYVSALTMLESTDGDRRSYLEIADVLEQFSPAPARDLEQLFRRVAFSILVSNTDDHLRNHGFLRTSTGWALSPAFDLNPNPEAPGTLSTTIDTDADTAASIDALLATSVMYRLTQGRAIEVVGEVESATSTWRGSAARLGLASSEIDDMAAAFDTPERTRTSELGAAHRTSNRPSPAARTGQYHRPAGAPDGGEFGPLVRGEPDVHL